jgi:predicted lipid-binding transport protein (Tim44 family)
MSLHTARRTSRPAATPAPSIVRSVVSSPGRPLDRAARAFMEPRFGRTAGDAGYAASIESVPARLGVNDTGHYSERTADYLATSALNDYGASFNDRGVDFGRVRIHTDSRAAESARTLNAIAYTIGDDIVFGAGQYAPETAYGQKVLAHELAHVVQRSSVAADRANVHRFTPFSAPDQSADASLGWRHPAGADLRVSDDGVLAAEDNGWGPGQSKRAWTTPAKISESNGILSSQKSRAKLRQKSGGQDIGGQSPASGEPMMLNEIEPFREGGGKFNLASDCGTAARQVMGSEPSGDLGAGLGAFTGFVGGGIGGLALGSAIGGKEHSDLGGAIGMFAGAVLGLLGGMLIGQEIEKGIKRKKDTPVVRGASGEEETLTARTYHGGNPTTPEEITEEVLKKEFGGGLSRRELLARYEALSPADKDAVDRKYGINKYAVPKVGQGLTISTEKDMPGYMSFDPESTWNFHYAAAVLRSGPDFITLESAAHWASDDWIFFMYGPETKGQSFHEYHGGTQTHGTKFQTYVVQPEKPKQ